MAPNPMIVEQFTAFADVCFGRFGDRVKYCVDIVFGVGCGWNRQRWGGRVGVVVAVKGFLPHTPQSHPRIVCCWCWFTFNEAWTFTWLASGSGKAPSEHPFMDMSVWPYVAGHNVLLAHAHAVRLYRSKYQKDQKGGI
eukprot:gene12121-biopygen7872